MSEHRIPAGIHKGRGIAGTEQYGTSSGGHDQIAVDVTFPDLGANATTFLVFSEAAAQYSMDRLRAMGWQGDDLSNLQGIDANEVDVEVKYEMYDGKERMKVQVLTGGGRVVLQNQMDDKGKRAFAAKFKTLAGASRSSSPNASAGTGGGDFPFGSNATKQAGGIKL